MGKREDLQAQLDEFDWLEVQRWGRQHFGPTVTTIKLEYEFIQAESPLAIDGAKAWDKQGNELPVLIEWNEYPDIQDIYTWDDVVPYGGLDED